MNISLKNKNENKCCHVPWRLRQNPSPCRSPLPAYNRTVWKQSLFMSKFDSIIYLSQHNSVQYFLAYNTNFFSYFWAPMYLLGQTVCLLPSLYICVLLYIKTDSKCFVEYVIALAPDFTSSFVKRSQMKTNTKGVERKRRMGQLYATRGIIFYPKQTVCSFAAYFFSQHYFAINEKFWAVFNDWHHKCAVCYLV